MKIERDKAITLSYTLTNDDGKVLDQTDKEQPFVYLHGHNGIIPGLEKALEGKETGDHIVVRIEAADAYGEYREELTQEVSKEMFGDADESVLYPGAQFHAQTNQGNQIITVKSVSEDSVVIDGNHPLAGTPLNFDVNVDEIRDATAEEIAHGHIHAAGGCGHDH